MEAILRNLRYALRVLTRAPAFTLTVVVTLALAIGANSAVFSAIDSILLRPLSLPDAGRLVRLTEIREGSGEGGVALARLLDWDRLNSTFEGISGYSTGDASLATGDLPEKIVYASVAPRFFEVLGVAPTLGRGFTEAEHRLGGLGAVLYGDRTWRTRLGADPDVVGSTIGVDEQSLSIVGVMPASFRFPLHPEVDSWTAIPIDAPWFQDRGPNESYRVAIARLKPGVTLEEARADLAVVQAQLAELYPETDRRIEVGVSPLKEMVVGEARGSLWLLFGAVSVLLLIACTNIAAMLLSRAAQREQEIAIRYSLGASRRAVAVQSLVEAAVLAVTGAALGLAVAAGASGALRALAPDLPRLDEVGVDSRILLYTLASGVIVTFICGLAPAVRNTRGRALSLSGRGQVSGRHSAQWLLVGVQVALSVTLLAGAGLLVRSFEALTRVEPGFDPAQVLVFRSIRNAYEWDDYDRVRERIDRILDEVAELPGVEATANSAGLLPGIPDENRIQLELVEGRDAAEPALLANGRYVSTAYFETLQIPLLSGELCRGRRGSGDQASAPDAVVNSSFAQRYFPGRSVTGLTVRRPDGTTHRIAGIVGDIREQGIDREPGPTVYICDGAWTPFTWYLVRTSVPPLTLAGAVRAKINGIEPLEAVHDVASLDTRIDDGYAQNRLRTLLLTLFAGAALSLACLGLYGTLSYVVNLRRREVGLRVALGALSSDIVGQFLLKALRVVGVACAAGLMLSFAFTRVLSGMLYGVSPNDLPTFAAAVGVVLLGASAAALQPALRASRIEPMQALREE